MSIEVAKGFSESMVIIGPKIHLLYAIIIIILYLIVLLNLIVLAKKKKIAINEDTLFASLIGTAIVFFSFKHGFVRQDGHMVVFYYTIPFLTGIIYLFSKRPFMIKLFITAAFLSFIGMTSLFTSHFIINSLKGSPIKNKYYDIINFRERQNTFEERKKNALSPSVIPSEWNEIIGDNTIQILPWELSYAFANNWQGWIPNPVLQLYSIYTKKLDEYSAYSFSNERAPRYILAEYNTIDNRNMFLDTPQTWNAILYNYKVVKSDASRLLLERRNVHSEPNLVKIESNVYRFGDNIIIPPSDNHVYARISIETSVLGKIITTFFRCSPPMIKLRFENDDEVVYRVIPNTLKNPVLIDAIPGNFQPMKDYLEEKTKNNYFLKEISFMNKSLLMFKNEIKIDWYYSQQQVNKINYIYNTITELPIPKDIELLKQYIYDVVSVNLDEEENIVLDCGTIDPQFNVPLQPIINKTFVKSAVIELVYTNTKSGYLQIFYDYGNGLNEENSTRYSILTAIDEKVIRLPIEGWQEGLPLVCIRIDPPDGTKFVIKNINILSEEEIRN